MNLSRFLFIFFNCLLTSILASKSKSSLGRRTRWSDEVQGETEHQLSRRIFVPLPNGTTYEQYRPLEAIGLVPHDIWHVIAVFLDAFSVWNFGLTCKYFGAMVRNNKGGLFYALESREALLSILWNSDLILYQHMSNTMTSLLSAINAKYHPSEESLVKMFRARAGDLYTAALPMIYIHSMTQCEHISKAIEAHLYRSVSDAGYYYLPPSGIKLFDRIDPREIAQLVNTKYFGSMFSYCLLMDYIVPSYMNQGILPESDLTSLRYLLQVTKKTLVFYFECLNWAIYFLTGATRVNDSKSKHIRAPIERHLSYLGLSWKTVCNPKTFIHLNEDKIKSKESMMPAILLAAKHWGLDWMGIAEKTAGWAPLCQNILHGTIPKYLTDAKLTLQEMVKIFTQYDVEPVFVYEGYLVTSITPRGTKRPHESTPSVDSCKKRKLEPSATASCLQTIEENVFMLLESSGIQSYQVQEITQTMLQLCEILRDQISSTLNNADGERMGERMEVEFDVSPYLDVGYEEPKGMVDPLMPDIMGPFPPMAGAFGAPMMIGVPMYAPMGAPMMGGPMHVPMAAPAPVMGGPAPMMMGPAPVVPMGPAPVPAPMPGGPPAAIPLGPPPLAYLPMAFPPMNNPFGF